MNSGILTGWRNVFSFTFSQDTKGKFKRNTILIGLLFLIVGAAISIIMALVEHSNNESVSSIEKVYVINESDLNALSFDALETSFESKYPNISFEITAKDEKEIVSESKDSKNLLIKLQNDDLGYKMLLMFPEESQISKGEAEGLLEDLSESMEVSKLISSGISLDKLSYAMSPININTISASDDQKSEGEDIMGVFLPMMVAMLMYFIILVYGMTMGNAISIEKTSKLMEMMLTMTKPAALILGKILALTTAAIIQVISWIALFVGGFFAGDFIAQTYIYPEYHNHILEVLNLITGSTGGVAFSAGAIILMLITIVFSLLFFFLLAATLGSLAQKPDEVQSLMGIFQIISVAAFMASIYIPMSGSDKWDEVLRIIPFTGAFVLPTDILLGNVGIAGALIHMLVFAVFILFFVWIAGKLYMNQLFHRGESILEILKKKKEN